MDSTSISSAILKITEQIDVLIQTVKPLVENSVTSFVDENVKKLALIGTYANFFSELNVDGRDDAEKIWERALIRDSEIEEKVDLLFVFFILIFCTLMPKNYAHTVSSYIHFEIFQLTVFVDPHFHYIFVGARKLSPLPVVCLGCSV